MPRRLRPVRTQRRRARVPLAAGLDAAVPGDPFPDHAPSGLRQFRGEQEVAAAVDRGPGTQTGILAQDRRLQLLQLPAGFDPELLGQRAARVAVGLERLGLPAAAVERQHPQRVQPLPPRALGQQRVELDDRLAVAPGGEILLDGQLDRARAQLLEAARLQHCEGLADDIGERRSTQSSRAARTALTSPARVASATSRSKRATSTASGSTRTRSRARASRSWHRAAVARRT